MPDDGRTAGDGAGGKAPRAEARALPERRQLRSVVADAIRRRIIISGSAPPGSILRLAPLSEALNVSTTPVREALLLLAQEGWVTQEAKRGFQVAPIRRQDVEDTYFVYEYAAGELAARAAKRVGREQIGRLRDLDAEIARLADDDDRLTVLNRDIHVEIYAIANAPRFEWFADAASSFVPREAWLTIPGWSEHNRDGHGPVIDALERGPAAAREAMTEHIEAAARLLLDHLDRTGFFA